ncbi:MAG: hypothetical protein FWH37_09020 [Candidatus Bathyarchaeota archaeon]|nr:hypothetical protein [Candidatus Termiticorpusculum sp.]
MSGSSRSGSRYNSKAKIQKSSSHKKAKAGKPKASARYLREESAEVTLQSVIDKTIGSVERLGSQVFALSPFSQYYDDWFVNLRQVISEFEAFSEVHVDDVFTLECAQVFLEIQGALADFRVQEYSLSEAEKALYDVNREVGVVEADYGEKSQLLSGRRSSVIQQLSSQVKVLEEDIVSQEELKFGVFQFGAKKVAAKKLEFARQRLVLVKKELDVSLQDFKLEQEKLHELYVVRKQELAARSVVLRNEIEQREVDVSIEARKKACAQLNNAINGLIQRLQIKTNS